jgi:hypothetical protein
MAVDPREEVDEVRDAGSGKARACPERRLYGKSGVLNRSCYISKASHKKALNYTNLKIMSRTTHDGDLTYLHNI